MLKIGDIVKLKSGGPAMTVNQIEGSDRNIAVCAWFVNDEVKSGRLASDALEKAEAKPSSY